MTNYQLPITLHAELVLRFATSADSDALAKFNGANLGNDPVDAKNVAAWTRDFISESHPTCGSSNVTIVQDTRARKIVSSMCLIPQTWTYAGIPFDVGRIEAVSTDPEYRRRGLIRAQFQALHAKSAAMGHLAQGITGIPWYYRQFGYEYALDLGGGRAAYFDNIPALKEGESELYRLRAMTRNDLPFVMPLYDRDSTQSLIACPRSESLWRHLLNGYSHDSFEHRAYQIIESADGRAVGYLAPSNEMNGRMFQVVELAAVEGQSLRALMPSVLRALKGMAETEAASQKKEVNALLFAFNREHPLFNAIPDLLARTHPPYAWYLRVPDVPEFLRHVAPVLDARLARSPLAGHSGEIRISEHTSGMRLVFENGKLVTAEAWQPVRREEDASFPPLVFLQLLFGFRSLAELRAAFPDCRAKDDAAVLLDILFPRASSRVMPVG